MATVQRSITFYITVQNARFWQWVWSFGDIGPLLFLMVGVILPTIGMQSASGIKTFNTFVAVELFFLTILSLVSLSVLVEAYWQERGRP